MIVFNTAPVDGAVPACGLRPGGRAVESSPGDPQHEARATARGGRGAGIAHSANTTGYDCVFLYLCTQGQQLTS